MSLTLDLPEPEMSVSQANEGFTVRGKSEPSMRLPLHAAGDHNGNAFPISSSSSSCSSSCLGESSPESLRSLSSLSGGRTDSPLDYDMFEVTLTTTVMTKTDHMSEVAVDDDVSVEKIQTTELTESNDNSVSVYLDANSSEYHQDTWNDNDNVTLALSLTTSNNDDLSSGSGDERRRGSLTPDSDPTEIPADDDDDDDDEEEEALFLSVSSDMGVQKSSPASPPVDVTPSSSAVTADPQDEGTAALTVAEEGPEVPGTPQAHVQSQARPPASEDCVETTQASVPSQPEAERHTVSSKPHTSQPNRAAKTKPATAPLAGPKTAGKPAGLEAKRVSKVDLRNVKAKVGSRSAPSPPKTPSQNKSTPVTTRTPAKKEEGGQTGEKKQRPSAGPVKVAVVLRPIRGKGISLKTNHKSAAGDSAHLERKSAAISRTLSTSTSSLASEVAEEGPQSSDRKGVHEEAAEHGTVEASLPSEESVEEQREDTGTASMVEKPRSPGRKVSSKLGPNARQQGRGVRAEKEHSGPVPSLGSGTGPPGQGSPGPRQPQSDGSTLRGDDQSAGGGSPTKARQSQTQCQGIPKPRTTTALTALGPTGPNSNSKPAANQQPALGSVGRAAAPAASKLPVKGLPTSLSSSSVGGGENNGSAHKASPGAPTGAKPEERPSRSALPVGGQATAKPLISNTAATSSTGAPSDAVPGANSGGAAAPKPPAMRSRALSLQARTTAAGLKTPTVTVHSAAKAAAAGLPAVKCSPAAGHLLKQTSQYPLQRSGSARLSRAYSSVDKNKPRDAPTRPTNASNASQAAAPTGGSNQIQQQAPSGPVPDVVNANTPALPVPTTDPTNAGSGTTGVSIPGFKARTGLRSSPKTGSRLQNAPKPGVAGAVVADGTVAAKQSKEQAEKKNQAIHQLRRLLVQGNKRVEALATVIQHLFTEREEALKQKKELSLQLATLRDELVTSSQCCEHLQKEKEEVRVNLEEALKRLEEQHKEELVQLEDRLRSFYQTEWDKVHQMYQEEADKCRMLMEQQIEELRSRQEAEKKNQEVSHNQRMESLKLEYETSIEELKRIQQTDLENLEKTLKETETSLSEKVSELSAEKEALNEKLTAEEERRKRILNDKSLKDSHTLYLEQELESLKVVLEIKNNQLHQKEKKLMDMDKLVESNVKLEECLKKVQQENEDYKARMDKHAALSKQLSSEQAILQQTLQKESKVNKRLSMENEELLWKLHNGDLLASPRRLSPTSPFSSPRNSASFPTAAPLSPR
ncbi:uncharacterized protein V6R79_010375 [Siganus canaliculatus]